MADKGNISYEIKDTIGVISEGKGGWNKELNKVEWNGRPAKYDIRDWAQNHEKLGKGITLTTDELRELGKLINEEVKKIAYNETHPANNLKGDLKEEESGQQSFDFSSERNLDVSKSVNIDQM